MNNLTDVVKSLIIINVIIFLGTSFIPFEYKAMGMLHFFKSPYFQPFQVISSMFLHADFMHLLFNMFSLFFLGPYVENTLGPKRFLTLYLLAGFGASALHVGYSYYMYTQGVSPGPVLGASGCVYGVMIAFATMFPNLKLMVFPIPVPVAAKYLGVGLIAIGLYSGFGGANDGIAHFAHLGGALVGFLLIKYWKMSNLR